MKRLVSIHYIDDKILLVFEKFPLFYLFVVVESKANKLNFIFGLEYDKIFFYMMSGRNIFSEP